MAEIFPFLNMRGPEFLKLYLGALVVATILAILIRRLASTPSDKLDQNPPLNPYDISFLIGGKRRTMEAAIAALVHEEILRIDSVKGTVCAVKQLGLSAHPALRGVHEAIAAAGAKGLSYVKAIRTSPAGVFSGIEEKLEYYGLIVPWGRAMMIRLATFTLIASVIAMGAAKISIGLERGRPIGFLGVLTFFAVCIALYMLFSPPRRSVRGNAYAKDLAERADILRAAAGSGGPGLGGGDVATVAGLYGVGVLGGMLLGDLRVVHQRYVHRTSDAHSTNGTSCGSSGCGGSSCGGGCGGGGCGGCGS